MSLDLQVTVQSEAAQATLRELASTLDGRRRLGLMQVLGKGLEGDLQAHFLRRNARPNKRGFPRTNFWSKVRGATAMTSATADDATVTISDPRVKSHLFGATIRPRNARYLAIPNTAQAYGRSPRGNPIAGLFAASNKRGTKFLAAKNSDGSLTVHYWLKRSVTIARDPDTLPPTTVLDAAALRRAREYIDRITAEGGSSAS